MKVVIKRFSLDLNYLVKIKAINAYSKYKLKNLLLKEDRNIYAAFETFI
jgi:hypothetical protein